MRWVKVAMSTSAAQKLNIHRTRRAHWACVRLTWPVPQLMCAVAADMKAVELQGCRRTRVSVFEQYKLISSDLSATDFSAGGISSPNSG